MQDKSPRTIFNEALDQEDPAERARYLAEICGADASLRERILNLLDAYERAGGFLARPDRGPSAFAPGDSASGANSVTEKPGDKIGNFKLLQQIGEGGCGVVYMAE